MKFTLPKEYTKSKRKNFAMKAWKRSSSLKEYFNALRDFDNKAEMEERGN